MNILSVFTLKSSAKEVFSRDTLESFLDFAKDKIVSYVKDKDLAGAEKKAKVDASCEEWIKTHLHSNNSILNWCIDNIIVALIPTATQAIYDYLEDFIKGLTQKA
jgi:predicted nucleotide-binding protein (sugar kinase/HSP70/actin superfamily)